MNFVDTNADLIRSVGRQADHVRRTGAAQRTAEYLAVHGAAREPYLPLPLAIDQDDFDALASAGRALMSAQSRILQALCASHSRLQVLDVFGLPHQLADQIDWSNLVAGAGLIARFDVVPTIDGYRFCEINCDSTVAGFELFDCHRLYAEAVGWPMMGSACAPHLHIASLLRRRAAQAGLKRILVCDWSTYRGTGRFGFDFLCRTLQRELPHLEVRMAYEDDFPLVWLQPHQGRDMLVYRGFMLGDMRDGGAFLEKLRRTGAVIVNTFETEIRSNKIWFSMFRDQRWQSLLSAQEVAAIERFVPDTQLVGPHNIERLLDERVGHVFKLGNSNSGQGVFVGGEHDRDALRAILASTNFEGWTVQPLLHSLELELPGAVDPRPVPHRLVLGIYLVDGIASGLNVRASPHSRIVSVSLGTGRWLWASPMTAAQRETLAHCIASSAPAAHATAA